LVTTAPSLDGPEGSNSTDDFSQQSADTRTITPA
jgi:hypothetical protein